MKINLDIELIGKSLFFPKEKILVISDLHIGYEQQLNDIGILVIRNQFKEIKKEIDKLIKKIKRKSKYIKRIVILGDLKHEFGKISLQEWKEIKEFISLLKKECKGLIIIRGNHDNMLKPILKKIGLSLKDYYIYKNICFFHGHKVWKKCYDKKIKTWIVGHKHPAITIKEGIKKETYKCFLFGNYEGKKVVVLPSFFPLTEGRSISMGGKHFAFEINENDFEVYVIGKEKGEYKVYDFGKVKKNIKD